MKTSKALLTLVLLMLTGQSCGYTWIRMESTTGQKFWVRRYNDQQKQEQSEDRYVFKKWKKDQVYQRYTGNITSDTTHGSVFIQFDSVRVYLHGRAGTFSSIFTSGLISGQMLYCKMDSSCKPTEGLKVINTKTGEPMPERLWGWAGHTIRIDYFEEMKNIKSKPTERKFKFWVYPYKIRFNGGNDIFLLELTNENATRYTDLETFIRGASVTFLDRVRTMI